MGDTPNTQTATANNPPAPAVPPMTGTHEDPAPTPPGQTPATPAKPFYVGVKTLQTPEEAAEYIKNLEAKVIDKTVEAKAPVTPNVLNSGYTQTPVQKVVDPEDELSDELFSNPKEAIRKIQQQAQDKVLAAVEEREARARYWDEFYKNHPDLKSAERIVQSVLGERSREWAALPIGEATKKLVEESRKVVEGIRGPTGTRTQLPSGSTGTLPAAGTNGPAKAGGQEEPPETMIAQVRSLRPQKRA